MSRRVVSVVLWVTFALVSRSGAQPPASSGGDLERLRYNHPGLVVDLGVGLWASPLPMDYDAGGDLDLVVVCPDKPYNGTYVSRASCAPATSSRKPTRSSSELS